MTTTTFDISPAIRRRNQMNQVKRDAVRLVGLGTAIAVATMVALIFVSPFFYMLTTSFKNDQQLGLPSRPLLPMTPVTFNYQGQELPLYNVPINGVMRQLALKEQRRKSATFVDPQNPDADPIVYEDRVATLTQVMTFSPSLEVYTKASARMDFPRALLNTLAVTVISSFGAVVSAALVAYGFSRFRIPGSNVLFIVLMATIILPPQVTLIPTFIIFQKLGWIGTLLPLIVPHFFSNAYNVFLLRQYFLGIPNEMDEAAKVDGANPLQTFLWVVLPQARAALITVTLFHFIVIWGEFYNALIFTSGSHEAQPLSVALQRFQQQYSGQVNQMMAGAVLTMLAPLIIFFLAQRVFMQGVVITGVEK
jgi:multiple sugar transport system permease protein